MILFVSALNKLHQVDTHNLSLLAVPSVGSCLLIPVWASHSAKKDFMFKDTYISFNKKLKSTTSFKTQKNKYVAILQWTDQMTMVS